MSTYVLGDLQGCAAALDDLLAHIAFDPAHDRLWLVGDLVNRGPDSLGTLRRLVALGDRVVTVLGNHDLHLLGVAAGVRRRGRLDTIDDILAAPDRDALLDWLRHRPLAWRSPAAFGRETLLVHAGVLPSWTVADTLARAAEVETALRGDDWASRLGRLFGNEPARWSDDLDGDDRLKAIVNVLTRVRFCSADDGLDFESKDAPVAGTGGTGAFPPPPTGFLPWFDQPARRTRDALVLFGHWSTLGVRVRDDVIALDSGCVWGGALTAVRLEDRTLFRVPCRAALPHA